VSAKHSRPAKRANTLPRNEQRDTVVNYILDELPARCLWEGRITGVGYLEAFYIQVEQGRGEVVIVQAFDRGGCEVFSDRGTPMKLAELCDWLRVGPPPPEST
jgi:hypothetical protein